MNTNIGVSTVKEALDAYAAEVHKNVERRKEIEEEISRLTDLLQDAHMRKKQTWELSSRGWHPKCTRQMRELLQTGPVREIWVFGSTDLPDVPRRPGIVVKETAARVTVLTPLGEMTFVKSTGKAWGEGFRWYRIDPMVSAGE